MSSIVNLSMKPKIKSTCLEDASNYTPPDQFGLWTATPGVQNNCDKAIIATIVWTGLTPPPPFSGAPNPPIQATLTIQPGQVSFANQSLALISPNTLSFDVIKADWA
jgi:hypothetical protein